MVHKIVIFIALVSLGFQISCLATSNEQNITVGAEQLELYLPKLQNKRVALVVNQTSMIGNQHIVDVLLDKDINIQTIFALEHGVRGNAANGETINDSIDTKTGIPIISLYNTKKKPSAEDLNKLDVVIFDIQDVGCRFYTYISGMYNLMEACAENHKKLIVLDRPNPNGDYVDGPVLDMEYKSFVGMLPIPIVHGCTVGELAKMINGENWLANNVQCDLDVIAVKNYTHLTAYAPPIKPSPNLPNYLSIRLYPSLCLFEATKVSIGRGTEFPFQVIGYPGCELGSFSFMPKSIKGVSNDPLFENELCNGIDLRTLEQIPHFTLSYFIQFANSFDSRDAFWKSKRWFELLTGSGIIYQQINNGESEESIRLNWEKELKIYKNIRKQYLLYPDF